MADRQTQAKKTTKIMNKQSHSERRQGKDFLVRLLQTASLAGWALFVAASVVFHFARPELETGLHRYWGIEAREGWNESLVFWLLGLLGLCVVMSLIGILVRRRRARRASDSNWSNIFFLLVAAGSGLALVWTGA